MKKFLLIFDMLLILSACSSTQKVNTTQLNKDAIYTIQKNDSQEQKFINPIFYQPLEPRSIHSGYVYITPTFIKFMTPLDKNKEAMAGKCELLENQENFIKLLCDTSWQMLENGRMVTNTSEDIYTYEIKGIAFGDCLDIEEIIYEITKRGNEKSSTSHYCVTPPNYTPSESD